MNTRRKAYLNVVTEEGVQFSLSLAGPFVRFLGWLIDALIVIVGTQILASMIKVIAILSPDVAIAFQIILFFITSIGYRIVLEYLWNGKTVGKHVMGMRVIDSRLLGLDFPRVVIRNLLRFVDSFPFLYLIGGPVCFFDRRNRRLGDIAADTVVVYNVKTYRPEVENIIENRYNSLSEHPHLESRLRKKTTPEEARIAVQALMRRDHLEPEARIELFEQIAEHFQDKVNFPEEATFGLTPEQYVRNIVDTLYRKTQSRKQTVKQD